MDAQLPPAPAAGATTAGPAAAWGEPHLLALQALLDARPECVAAQIPRLVAALAAAARGPLATSPKLCQAMTSLAAGFGAALGRADAAGLAAAAAATRTFMTKGLVARLRQLAAPPAGADV
jgi:hypothetical protein